MNETDYNEKTCFDWAKILYNYPPKGKWIVVDIYTETRSMEVNIELHETTLRGGGGRGSALVFTKSFW